MKLKLSWKIMLAFVIVITAFYINYLYYRSNVVEGLDFNNFFTKFKKATGEAQATSSYEQFIGWLYSHPETSGNALNDIKTRAFQPTCEFKVNWSDALPNGLGRPVAPANKELANVAYKSWLDCLARNDQGCVIQLNDAMSRFMAPGCSFQTGKPISTYNTNYRPVF
jgi:hypothetical protein